MATQGEVPPGLPPEEAFTVLGNELRMRIVSELGAVDHPLSFTELRDRVGLRQGGQFNYHLDKLVGHFVEKTDDGYALHQPGSAVVQAILSGAVTENPVIEPTEVDFACLLCDAPVLVGYHAERVELYCTGCTGQYEDKADNPPSFDDVGGYLGHYTLTPTGAEDRSPYELLEAASLWAHLENVALANGLCMRCGGMVETDVTVCGSHNPEGERCPTCSNRHSVQVDRTCTTCGFSRGGMAITILATHRELRKFVAEQGIDPIVEGFKWGWDCDEDVHSIEPLRADFTFEVEGEAITLHTGADLEVVDVTRHESVASMTDTNLDSSP